MGNGIWTIGDTEELTDYERVLYEGWVDAETHNTYNKKTTTVVIKLKNGFEIVGTTGCEDPTKFSEDLGRLYALKVALRNLGEFTAFYRAQAEYAGGVTEIRMNTTVTPEVVAEIRRAVGEGMVQVMRDPMNAMRGF